MLCSLQHLSHPHRGLLGPVSSATIGYLGGNGGLVGQIDALADAVDLAAVDLLARLLDGLEDGLVV
jgi:hypothetical protein